MLAFVAGFVVGVIAAVAYNHFQSKRFDKLTKNAADEIRKL